MELPVRLVQSEGMPMEIAVGADHAGFVLKQDIAEFLRQAGHAVLDLGTFSTEPVDYPDYAEAVGLAVREGRVARGILICGSGVGAAVAANKIPGIRACLCHDTFSAHQGVEDDDMNIIVFGGRVIGAFLARDLVTSFLGAEFSGKERHRRRLEKIRLMEEKYGNRKEFGT
jgi:RpiB/LacA/LacB family sugar-phosphate isomerase